MAFCAKCGSPVDDNSRFCPKCGAEIGAAVNEAAGAAQTAANDAGAAAGAANNVKQAFNTPDTTAQYDPEDIARNKGLSVLSYFGLLFLIPLFAAPQSKFARFHVNQGIVLCIFGAGYAIVVGILTAILTAIATATLSWGFFTFVSIISGLLWFLSLAFAVLAVLGIINAATGKAKELPVIGKIKILK